VIGRLNVELKARCKDPGRVRAILDAAGAEFRGVDEQRDIYFKVPHGRLKLRRGTIERALIHYERPDAAGVRPSQVTMSRLERVDELTLDDLEGTLTKALGIRSVVGKRREIRYVGNVKFHLDEVPGLGAFVEIEAIESDQARDEPTLRAQCESWRDRLGIETADMVAGSYGDLVSSSPRRHP
jgi:predicted adenylyl cyclase CyaB